MIDEPPERVLVVDDEEDLRRLLQFNLKEAGFVVELAATGAEALAAAEQSRPSVVLLDLMLPDMSGNEVCRRLRAHARLHDVGVLMLTARSDNYDRLLGFEVGCDDYVVKPFDVREVILRVRALSRRTSERRAMGAEPSGPKVARWRNLVVDSNKHRVTIDDAELSLRPLEFRLLAMLLENQGTVLSRARLLEDVWGAEVGSDVNARTVDTHVKRLRQRLGEYGDCIETVVGFGYRIKEP